MDFILYNINDVLQFKVKDASGTYATLKLAEMPLFKDTMIVNYLQVGSKQL